MIESRSIGSVVFTAMLFPVFFSLCFGLDKYVKCSNRKAGCLLASGYWGKEEAEGWGFVPLMEPSDGCSYRV